MANDQIQENPKASSYPKPLIVKISISIVAGILFMVHVFHKDWLPDDNLTIGLLIVIIFPWLIDIIEEMELRGGWKIRFRELEDKTDTLRKRTDRLFLSSLSQRLKDELRDFERNVHSPVELSPAYLRELSYLHNAGLIEFIDKELGFENMPKEVPDIAEYLKITELGREHLELARQLIR